MNDYKARILDALRGFDKAQSDLAIAERQAAERKALRAPSGVKAKPDIPVERDEQKALTKYLNAMGVLWFHPVNEGKRSKRLAAMLRAQGLKAGVPDVLIFTPCTCDGRTYPGVAIELKRRKGGVVSDLQDTWLQNLRACGWLAFVALGADDAIARLQKCKFVGGTRSKGKVCGTL
jgi:hypothetical protein